MKRRLVLAFTLLLTIGFAGQLFTQESTLTKKEQKKLDKEKRKEEKEKEAAEKRALYTELLKNKLYVFKASTLQGNRGDIFNVPSHLNFLAVQDSLVVYQFAFDNAIGWNGVGGATMEGYLNNYKFEDGGKNKPMTVNSRIAPKIGGGQPYYILNVYDDGNANLELTLSNGTRLKLRGVLTAPAASGIDVGFYY